MRKATARQPIPLQPPERLHFEIGGFAGHSWEITWVEGRLWYRENPNGQGQLAWLPWKPFIEPSVLEWEALDEQLTRAAVWRWPRHVSDPEVLDGTQWALSIRWGTRRKTISGSNAFPAGFQELEEALRGLATRPDPNREEVEELPG